MALLRPLADPLRRVPLWRSQSLGKAAMALSNAYANEADDHSARGRGPGHDSSGRILECQLAMSGIARKTRRTRHALEAATTKRKRGS